MEFILRVIGSPTVKVETIEDTYLCLSQVQPLPILLFVAVVDEAYISFSSESGI